MGVEVEVEVEDDATTSLTLRTRWRWKSRYLEAVVEDEDSRGADATADAPTVPLSSRTGTIAEISAPPLSPLLMTHRATSTSAAAASTPSPCAFRGIGAKLARIEVAIYRSVQSGSLEERVYKLEGDVEIVSCSEQAASFPMRINAIYSAVEMEGLL